VTGAAPVVRCRVEVTGRVQGVFFRDTCQREAARHGVAGWVRNRPDGSVEAVFEGPAEAVAAMVAWARQGPSRAEVSGTTVHQEEPEGLDRFRVR
jgi:acylphosphatase